MEQGASSTNRWPGRVLQALRISAFALVLAHIVIVAAVIVLRIGYLYELEWMEGGMLDHVGRLLEGKSLYVAPSLDFVPFLYPPLYYSISALAAKLLGLSFLPLRSVSLASSIFCGWLIYRFASSEEGREAGWLAVGLFVATFFIGGAWFDLARVDMLFLALLLAAFSTVKDRQTAGRYALAGLLLGLAFLTKQTTLVAAAPFVGYALWRDKLKALPTPVVGIVIAGGVLFMLHRASSGWSSFYILELPKGHGWHFSSLISFWTNDLLGVLGIAVIVASAGILGMPSGKRMWWLFVVAGVGSAAFVSRLHDGGYVNVLIPLYAVGAVLFGIGAVRLDVWVESLKPRATIAASTLLYGAICVQFVSLVSNPAAQVPSRAHAEAGERVEAFMRAQSGVLYAPAHGYLAARSGHAFGAHAMAVMDLLRTDLEERSLLVDDFAEALTEQRFERILLPEIADIGLGLSDPHAESLYVRIDSLGGAVLRGAEAFRPVVGHPERPGAVYAPVLE